ncbi:MAG: molybdate ABC transporter substrate-binding protein [Treponema sp.]|nr:molybdate ABC transporter substrate-binding protein [Treponema sp.]
MISFFFSWRDSLIAKKIIIFIVAGFFLGAVSCKKKTEKTELTVLAAASLCDVCKELKSEYEKKNPHVELLFSFGGSGSLKAQIEAGAPCDIFISAATKQMEALQKKGIIIEESVKNLLENEVVLIAPFSSESAISSFKDLALPSVKMIAIGEPSSVPVGQYSKAIFESLDVWDKVSKKANFASDVRTVLSWVEESACDFGIVYATDAATSRKVRVVARSPESACPKVIYPAGIVKTTESQEESEKFMDFLFSEKAGKIYSSAGFKIAF